MFLLGSYLIWESLTAFSAWRSDPLKYIETTYEDSDYRSTAVTSLDDFR